MPGGCPSSKELFGHFCITCLRLVKVRVGLGGLDTTVLRRSLMKTTTKSNAEFRAAIYCPSGGQWNGFLLLFSQSWIAAIG